jgi:hypothetical protein
LDGKPVLQGEKRDIQASAADAKPVGYITSTSNQFIRESLTFGFRDLFGDTYTKGTKGGFVVYYVSGGKNQVTAFKPVGDQCQRTSSLSQLL